MLILKRRKKTGIKMENVYFADDCRTYRTDCDVVIFYSSRTEPAGLHYGSHTYTVHIGLEMDEEALLHQMSKSTRQDIRRALLNPDINCIYHRHPAIDEVSGFMEHYDHFAESAGITKVDGSLLKELLDRQCLALIYVLNAKGEVICGAIDIVHQERCYGAYAFTTHREIQDKRLAGQANKLLYWVSMREGKRAQCRLMDLAGVAHGLHGTELSGIDAFKMSFGGEVVQEYNFYYPYSWKGKLLIVLFKLMKKDIGISWCEKKTDNHDNSVVSRFSLNVKEWRIFR